MESCQKKLGNSCSTGGVDTTNGHIHRYAIRYCKIDMTAMNRPILTIVGASLYTLMAGVAKGGVGGVDGAGLEADQ